MFRLSSSGICILLFSAAAIQPAGAQVVTEGTIISAGTNSIPTGFGAPINGPLPVNDVGKTPPKPDLVSARRGSVRGFAPSMAALKTPDPTPKTVVGPDPNFFGFAGLTHADQRLASSGNQFSTEPPDQGLGVGNGYVVEAVNLAITIYDTSGNRLVPVIGLNQFFGLAPSLDRRATPGPIFGPSLSDPRVYFDHQLQRWFITVFEEDVDRLTGNATGRTSIYIAVSTTSNPTQPYRIYRIDTADDGSRGTQFHPGCPCFPDQPLIGADAYGFYVSTNEFSLFQSGFNGAQIYAMSKFGLATGSPGTLLHFSGIPLAEGVAYSVQPAMSLGFGGEPSSGVEYFLSALDFAGPLDNRIAVWALLNTATLNNPHPNLTLVNKVMTSEAYGVPPPAVQRNGGLPYGNTLFDVAGHKPPLALLDSNDDRMQQVVYENGDLWSALDTVVGTGTKQRAGIAYFIVHPTVANGRLNATMVKQGYVAAPAIDSLLYPSIGVTASGKAAMAFTLVGPTPAGAFLFSPVFFPSMAFTRLNANSGAGEIQLGAAGVAPEDGFSGYAQDAMHHWVQGTARWGDYSAAVADTDGSIWMAVEWIPGTPRTLLANWGTFIGRIY